ncbi:hypothetical protein [Nonomuraea gerenzanensis]|uniref:DUF998 domain-containing protein n=1 Tax=Nonomuraea gerenzanensis TaxID=93944 RepID=A0A1M4E5P5_9ACTN|nr:hypothetical protein [Nonomuraea gerenzanensis]UBU16276.1 hypothetical protein LCN96_15045 [Nonomuraea gerenzanensis]SBO94092.1 hypothetical protein BN4615_P3608 [Nonomuraea gerenzanensis]
MNLRVLAGGLVGGGGILFAVGNVLHPLEHNEAAHSAPTWEAAHLVFALGGLLVAAGLPLLVALSRALRASGLACAGAVALAVAFGALAPGAWFEAYVAPLHGVAEQVEGGAGGAVNAVAGMVWMASLVAFGAGLVWRGVERAVRLAGVALLVAAVVLILGPGLPVVEGLVIIPATVVAGVGLLTVGVATARTTAEPVPATA